MCRIGSVYFPGYCEGLAIKFCFFFSLFSYIFGFCEKRTEHISFLAFETNFLKQNHCDNNKTDACASHPVDINMLLSGENLVCLSVFVSCLKLYSSTKLSVAAYRL